MLLGTVPMLLSWSQTNTGDSPHAVELVAKQQGTVPQIRQQTLRIGIESELFGSTLPILRHLGIECCTGT
jgi:hypothetical protein